MKASRRQALQGYLFISPWLIGFLVFTLGPLLYSLYVSFSEYSLFGSPDWTGLDNYQRALFEEPLFWKSLKNTLYFVALNVPLSIIGSLLLAMLLNQNIRGKTVYRTMFYIPSITPVVATTLIWVWILRSDFGLLNMMLEKIGLPAVPWLSSTRWAIPSLVLISLWEIGGQRMLIFLAGLQGINQELYEAADIDGGSVLQKFFHITLPMLSPTLLFNLIMSIISSFNVFTTAFIATKGGPANATLFYVLYLFKNAFEWFQMGYASALAWLLFIVVFAVTVLQFVLSKRWVYYESE
jgi:multiple sugar transport system permease protein